MVLHHLHIPEAQPGSIGQTHTVTTTGLRGSARFIHTSGATRGQHHSGRTERIKLARSKFQGEHPATDAVLNNQGGPEPLFMTENLFPHTLLIERVEHCMTGHVGRKCRARAGMPAEGPPVEFALGIPVERHPDMIQMNNVVRGGAAHLLDSRLIAQARSGPYRILGVLLPRIVFSKGGIQSVRRRCRMAA